MTSADVRDMLNLPSNDGSTRPVKKQKIVEKRPEGVSREVFALLGEHAAPVSIVEAVKYKEKPKWSQKVTPWEVASFTNPARSDGLVLKHWRKRPKPAPVPVPALEDASATTTTPQEPQPPQEPAVDLNYHFAKFNVKVSVPEYTDAEYSGHLQSPDWTREETDYLFDLIRDFDLRWVLIADRYDYQPAGPSNNSSDASTAMSVTPKPRTMEDLKSRYYSICSTLLSLHSPLQTRTQAEDTLSTLYSSFSAAQETKRKAHATQLLTRSASEAAEEAYLLTELRRILSNQDRLQRERDELYARLETPPSLQSSGLAGMYTTSQGLAQLMQTLLAADKTKKAQGRRSIPGGGPDGSMPGPHAATSSPALPSSATRDTHHSSHRDSLSHAHPGPQKKSSLPLPPERRHLPPDIAARYGISYHDRLTSGPFFRHDKVTKLLTQKSNIQAQRMAAALTELSIPPRLVMPTRGVCEVYEGLIAKVGGLLEVRKVRERVEGEVRVLQVRAGEVGASTGSDPLAEKGGDKT
ncbi:MAG: swr complex subunit, partial [Vezdaea acicularis]